MTTQYRVKQWLSGNYDEKSKATIRAMSPDEQTDAFYKDLEFGTGGLRGLLGVGSNRINRYTVGVATQGICNYLKTQYSKDEELCAAIAFDSRHQSDTLAQVVADVFSANGVKVFIFESLRPTPELSFAIRYLNCHTGVVLTASHNPKEYNGYKAYWNDGGQVVPPHDKNIIEAVNSISSIDEIKFKPNSEYIELIGQEVDQAYLEYLKLLSVSPDVIARQHDLKIIYSPIHGTGIKSVPQALEKFGFTNVHMVEAQSTPNGDFPTVVYPNPEEAEAMKLGLQKAQELDADILMATDPDTDRVGIAVKDQNGDFSLLNGNQTGALLIAYMLEAWKKANKLNGKQMVIKTIVTTDLIAAIAKKFGVTHYDTLTGFKYIAELIREKEGKEEFIAGGEESYGYLVGDGVRDKDAVAACALIAEMVAYAKDQGISLFDWLLDIYEEHGCYQEGLLSLKKTGKSGAEEIQAIMKGFRQSPPKTLASEKVVKVLDYQAGVEGFPKSNVLQFFTEAGTKISVRPSGTEPKIKFYVSVKSDLSDKSDYTATKAHLMRKIEGIKEELGT